MKNEWITFVMGVIFAASLTVFGAALNKWGYEHERLQKLCEAKSGTLISDGFWGQERCYVAERMAP